MHARAKIALGQVDVMKVCRGRGEASRMLAGIGFEFRGRVGIRNFYAWVTLSHLLLQYEKTLSRSKLMFDYLHELKPTIVLLTAPPCTVSEDGPASMPRLT